MRKHFWVLNLLTIGLCALFLAQAIGQWVGASLSSHPTTRRISAPTTLGIQPPIARFNSPRDITKILDRNVFCSSCEKVLASANQAQEADQPLDNTPVKSSLNLKLIATLISEEDKNWSYAVIMDGEDNETRSFQIGGKISASAVLTDVLDQRVLLLNGQRKEYLELDSEETPASRKMPAKSATSDKSSSSRSRSSYGLSDLEKEVGKSIKKVGEGKYELERSALNKVLSNTTLLARSARIVPSVQNGQPNGFKLYAIRPGSIYSMLGMHNGDTINAINGHAMTTPDKALELYTKLRNASHLSISFSRQGKTVSHEYTIR